MVRPITLDELALSNALVTQKTQIVVELGMGRIGRAILFLSFVSRVWEVTEYGYKTDEMVSLIGRAIARCIERDGNSQLMDELSSELQAIVNDLNVYRSSKVWPLPA